ncbi:MAG: Inner membrane protein YjcH [Delftia tsuruhatensis]|nr:MAG: Inner membrane protein YjcH [Delftia tsuruhatensis]
MTDPVVDKIQRHPKYQELRSRRNRLCLFLTLLMLVVYYGYIALIAFDKSFLAQPIGAGVTSLGIPIAMGVIVFSVIVTGLYVRRANGEYDKLTQDILKDATK